MPWLCYLWLDWTSSLYLSNGSGRLWVYIVSCSFTKYERFTFTTLMLFYTSTVGISHRTRGLNISAPIKSEVLSDNSMRLRCRLLPPLLRMTEILYLKKSSAARDFALPIRRFFERKRMIFWNNFEFYSITKEDSLPPPLVIKSNYDSIGLSNCLPVSAPVVTSYHWP